MDVDQQRLYDTTNASVWAEEFAKVCPEVDQGLMIGWFANAIETGRDAGRSQFREHMRAAADAVYFGDFPPEVETALIDGSESG